jgi:glycerol-3-phosphate cytidylyltransferase
MRIITFGTYDLFHIGHLNILRRCKQYNIDENNPSNTLIVGVSSDKLNYSKKDHYPIIPEQDRLQIVENIRGCDIVFLEESLELKCEYCLRYNADILIMGDDHIGRFDFLRDKGIEVIYLPRTENISTSCIIDGIRL